MIAPFPKKGLSDAERRVWVKGQLELRGESFATIARELGVSRQAVGRAMTDRRPRMERAIAAKLGMPPEQIWPERYGAGKHCKRGRKPRQ
ncbi:helix-turn-helix domain-containing protein [Geoalkalibacter subterraneus]|uniref:helix-turn-helix domain-containing protein n=1 Tax=Geoalkalibacter subterraneus TaxID=483547 RepID=UPI000693FB9F|nr:helix-turn-helix domain-containing protein [Geoalkalibacter subterraneus]